MAKPTKKPTISTREIPLIPPDELIDPYLLEYAKKLRAGKRIEIDQKFAVPCNWEMKELERIHDGIREWLKQGDFQILAKLLQNEPERIVHPVIMTQLRRLRSLTRKFEKTDTDLEFYIEEQNGPLFSPGTRHAARKALLTLFQGLWDGLGSGGILHVKRKRIRGRPTDWESFELEELLEDYNDLRTILDDEAAPTQATEYPLRRMSRESKSEFLKRITDIVRETHRRSKFSKQPYSRNGRIGFSNKPLPQHIVQSIVKQAIPNRSVQVHILLSGLLAHDRHNDHTKWYPLYKKIGKAEVEFPHLDRRKFRTEKF